MAQNGELPVAIQYSLRPSPLITWRTGDAGTPVNLIGATITARIFDRVTGLTVDSAGTFTVTDAPNGVFRWDFDASDVSNAGNFEVQFVATYSIAPTVARTFIADWKVGRSL